MGKTKFNRIGGRFDTIRSMLLAAGVGDFNATLSIPYMYFLPTTCDPYQQGVIQIVEGLQNLLNARGARLEISGWMDQHTMDALASWAGPQWKLKTWVQLYGDVLSGQRPAPKPTPITAPPPPAATGDIVSMLGAAVTHPLAWVAGGALAYYLARKRA